MKYSDPATHSQVEEDLALSDVEEFPSLPRIYHPGPSEATTGADAAFPDSEDSNSLSTEPHQLNASCTVLTTMIPHLPLLPSQPSKRKLSCPKTKLLIIRQPRFLPLSHATHPLQHSSRQPSLPETIMWSSSSEITPQWRLSYASFLKSIRTSVWVGILLKWRCPL